MSDLDDPVVRSTAVSPASIESGAVISFSADFLVATGDGVVAAIESRLSGPSASICDGDRWLTDAVPVLCRGSAWIVPLAWIPDHPDHDARVLRGRVNELWSAVRAACEYRHGAQIGIDLDESDAPETPYAAELVRTGARRADWWEADDSAIVLVVYGDPIPAPIRRMAVHVVPIGWVSSRRPTAAKKMPTLDLAWSWTDVVAFAQTDVADAADSLAGQDKSQK
ncbi:hypothetical protein QL996_15420 [Planococcus sp. APC 4015]|nr:hypothetical protein [Planococcus sp. APC 4015]